MKIMITGGAGFIGSHTVEALLDDGHIVEVIDNLSRGKRENLPTTITLHDVDIESKQAQTVVTNFKPDAIVHLAAQMDVRKSVAHPAHDATINVTGTIQLLEAAQQVKTKLFLLASSGGAIYGEQSLFPADEHHPISPESPYGLSKFCAEQYLNYYARKTNMRTASLRFGNVYGPRQDPHGEAGVIAIFARKLLAHQPPTINGDGHQTRDYIHVADCVEAARKVIQHPSATGAFNIGTGIETSVVDIARKLAQTAGYQGDFQHAPAMQGEQMRSVLSSNRAHDCLQWSPRIELEQGLEQTVDWFRTKMKIPTQQASR